MQGKMERNNVLKADQLMIGCWVYVGEKLVRVSQITKKKIGYHLHPSETRMRYARMCEIMPVPINSRLASTYNGLDDGVPLYWDNECKECEHQYYLNYRGVDVDVRYLHELQILLRALGFGNWLWFKKWDENPFTTDCNYKIVVFEKNDD